MATDPPSHPRPDQAEEPVDDVGASNADLDAAHHGHDDHGHDDHGHDDHGDHPADDPKWVLLPLVVGLVIGAAIVAALGLDSQAIPFHQVF